jgi:hypothetical protein
MELNKLPRIQEESNNEKSIQNINFDASSGKGSVGMNKVLTRYKNIVKSYSP